jgi:uncharacterized phiE125 gp8 family phage protein
MDLRLVSDPLTQADKLAVVPVAEVKRHLGIFHDDADDNLADDIEAAYDYLSGPNGWLGGCCLLNEAWVAYLPSRLDARVEIPLRPLAGSVVTGFGWLQSDGSYDPVLATAYHVVPALTAFPAIQRATSVSWPYTGSAVPAAYKVEFTAGFGTDREDIPSPIRKGIRLLAGHYYRNREATGTEGRTVGQKIEFGLQSLCGRYRFAPDHS